jgi:excisionase family DNA binding protein
MPATPSRIEDLPELLTVREMADFTRIGIRQAYELVRSGDLPSVRLGRSIRIPKRALVRFVQTDVRE